MYTIDCYEGKELFFKSKLLLKENFLLRNANCVIKIRGKILLNVTIQTNGGSGNIFKETFDENVCGVVIFRKKAFIKINHQKRTLIYVDQFDIHVFSDKKIEENATTFEIQDSVEKTTNDNTCSVNEVPSINQSSLILGVDAPIFWTIVVCSSFAVVAIIALLIYIQLKKNRAISLIESSLKQHLGRSETCAQKPVF